MFFYRMFWICLIITLILGIASFFYLPLLIGFVCSLIPTIFFKLLYNMSEQIDTHTRQIDDLCTRFKKLETEETQEMKSLRFKVKALEESLKKE